MGRKRSIISVREAVEIAFRQMDNKFQSVRLCQVVRELTGRAFLMDGTILRRLREAREDNPAEFDYRCIDNEAGIYKKEKQADPVSV